MAAGEVQRTRSASPFEAQIGFSRAVRVGDRIFVSGTAPIGPDGLTVHGGPYEQARRCFTIILDALAELGASAEHVVRTRMFITDPADWEEIGRAHGDIFREVRPAATMVVAGGLLDPEWRVEIEAEAILPAEIVRPAHSSDRLWMVDQVRRRFDAVMFSRRGQTHDPASLPAVIAWRGGARVGMLAWRLHGEDAAEILLMSCDAPMVGEAMIQDVERRLRALGCRTCLSVITNDELDALHQFQRRGFQLTELRTNAHPGGQLGLNGLMVRDEVCLSKAL
ncbi:MAG: RidA family protein [Myxococcota bacterium]